MNIMPAVTAAPSINVRRSSGLGPHPSNFLGGNVSTFLGPHASLRAKSYCLPSELDLCFESSAILTSFGLRASCSINARSQPIHQASCSITDPDHRPTLTTDP